MNSLVLSPKEIDRVIEMAWEDRTPFEAIKMQFFLNEADVIALMRKEMKMSSFKCGGKEFRGELQSTLC